MSHRHDRLHRLFSGGITYTNSGELTSGNINVGPTTAFGAVSSVTGSGQIQGANGGLATVSFNVNAFAGLPVYLGIVAVTDPSAGLSQSTMVLFGKVNKAGCRPPA